MEVKPGYKLTETGVIPEEWIVETIGDLIKEQVIIGHLDGNHGELYPRSNEFKPYGVPYIGANDFDEGDVNFRRCKFLSTERAAKFRKGVARDGDVLFAHNATVGPVALLRTDLPFVILSTTATYFRCNPERLNNSYLKGALQSSHFVKQYQAVMAQSTRFQVPITTQRKLSLVISPLPEQRAIAAALNDVDALLGGLDRLIAKKRDLKQAALQQLLTGQTRLPGFHGEWEVKRLGDIAQLKNGYAFQSSTYTDLGRYKVVTIANVQDGFMTVDECSKIASQPKDIQSHQCLCRNDILISMTGNVGRVCRVNDDDCLLNQRVGKLIPAGIDDRFLFSVLRQRKFLVAMGLKAKGGAQGNLAKSDITEYEVVTPVDKEEQIAIATILSDMDAELAALEARRDKTRALKQAMMQELLTGRTRLI